MIGRTNIFLSVTGRRDGSSRFGPGKQFGNFGSVGAAWIFTQENLIQRSLRFLSFGKLRGSYGTTGNDQIGDYQYLDLYSLTRYTYSGTQGLYPRNLFNPDLAWEIDKKLEVGIELGFLKDRVVIQASIYRNRTGNLLVSTPVSLVTGYTGIFPTCRHKYRIVDRNLYSNTINVKTKDFVWSSSLNLSITRNKLLSFPGLATSPYAQTYIIGQPINLVQVYHMIGVNDTTGIYQFADQKGSPTYTPNASTDKITHIKITPTFYGGFENSFSYKGLSLDVLFQFVKQTGMNIFGAYSSMPGTMSNMPIAVLNRWQKPGDKKPYQQFSQDYSSNVHIPL